MRLYIALFLLVFGLVQSQISTEPKDPLVKDPYFSANQNAQKAPAEKIKLIHSDFSGIKPEKHNGNFYFEGNVQFSHQGSLLSADEVVIYKLENFVKAYGNVKLQNADGSVITADEMEYDGNTERGIARKNVVLTDPKQTIKTETLYYDRKGNQAYYDTGGTIIANGSVTYSQKGTYNIATKTINIGGNIQMENDQYTLTGANISQNQVTNIAILSGPTIITNKKNPSNKIYTEDGTYNQNTKEVWLRKNNTIYYNGKTLKAKTMYFNQITGFGTGKDDVTLNDPKENRYIKGGYGEIYEKKDSAMITEKPYAVKILEKDSIYFGAEKFLSYQKPDSSQVKKSFLRAFKKARMFKSNAQARADSLSFNETDGILHLFKSPILWSGEKQVTGDKIEAYFNTSQENIDSLRVIGNAFAISKVDSLNQKDEFNQVKGRLMLVYYKNNEINLAKVIGNAQAITYAEDENQKTKEKTRIGISLSTCGTIEALFEERKIQVIECNIGANIDTYPMSKIADKDRFFPDFNWNTKDRLRKWRDIFLDSPNYPETHYISDNKWYKAAESVREKAKEKEEAKKPKRTRK